MCQGLAVGATFLDGTKEIKANRGIREKDSS